MNIRVDLNYPIKDGTEVVFRSPVDCSQVTGLKVYYPENGVTVSKEFAFADAHGNNVGDIDHLFAENVVVKVILDVTTGMAFVQNADTNAYLEQRIDGVDLTLPQDLTPERKATVLENIWAENVQNRVTTIDETADDEHYPTAKAVRDYAGQNGNGLLTVETITIGGDEPQNIPVSGLALDLTTYSAKVGGGFYINPVITPSNATNKAVLWASNATNIATVDGSGYVECVAEGDAVISCTTVDGGFTATCSVSVAAAESGGGDEPGGDDTGGDTTVYFKDSPYTLVEGSLMKPNGTTGAVSSAGYLVIPYTEGITIATCMNSSWNTSTYPHFVVLDSGTYTPVLGEATGAVVKTGVAQHIATFTGYGDDAVIYANLAERSYMQSDQNGSSNVDSTTFYYYIIPGGEA